MTIDSIYYNQISTNDGDVEYPFSLESIDTEIEAGNATYMLVYSVDAGEVYALIPDTEYTIVLNPHDYPIADGGVVILNTPLPADYLGISIQRKTPITNDQDFANGDGSFNTPAFEFALDKNCMILQEIDGTLCDCSDSGGNFTSVETSSFTAFATTHKAFIGYHDGFGLVATNSTGEAIGFNSIGYCNQLTGTPTFLGEGLMRTVDGGANWALGGQMGTHYTLAYPITCMQYHAPLDTWFALPFGDDNNTAKYWYSQDDCATWNYIGGGASGNYNHGFIVDENDDLWVTEYNGGPNEMHQHTNPLSLTPEVSYSFTEYRANNVGTANWHKFVWGTDQIIHAVAGQGSDEISLAVLNKSPMSEAENYSNSVTETRHIATNNNGGGDNILLCLRTEGGGSPNVEYDYINKGLESSYPDPPNFPLPITTLVFPENVDHTEPTYDPITNRFIVIARADDDHYKLLLKYCFATDVTTWFDLDPIYVPWTVSSSNDRQLYWSHGNTYYYAYLTDAGAEYSRLIKIVLGQEQPKVPAGAATQSLLNFENMPDGTVITDTGIGGLSWSVQGDAAIVSGELVLDGTGDFIQCLPGQAFWELFSGTTGNKWTIETKVRISSTSNSTKQIMNWRRSVGERGIVLQQPSTDGTKSRYLVGDSASYPIDVTSSLGFVVTNLVELSITRNINDYYFHVNGVYQGTNTAALLIDLINNILTIGTDDAGNGGFPGEVLRYRMTTGTPLYGEENYTPESGHSYAPIT